MIVDHLRTAGYDVAINDPYKGVELVKRYSDPFAGRHSVQLEVNRRLFMDEVTLAKTEDYLRMEQTIATLCQAIITYTKEK